MRTDKHGIWEQQYGKNKQQHRIQKETDIHGKFIE